LFLNKFPDFELLLIRDNIDFTFDLLNNYLERNSNKGDSFVEFCKKEFEIQNFAEATKKNHRVFFKALEEFKPKCTFRDINYDLISKFDYF
jgi:hypothetical protein